MVIRVAINGAFGKMGRVSVDAFARQPEFELVAKLGRDDDLKAQLASLQPDVVLDFTLPDCVFENTQIILASGCRPVVGTSGLTVDQIEQLTDMAKQRQLGGLIVPNFSIGAILMMQFAAQASSLMSRAHIVELHHEKKVDAPSGTARKTAELMAAHCQSSQPLIDDYQGVPIASVRLPGLFAHQAVVFEGLGETLTIKHDATNRSSMMAGVMLACKKVCAMEEMEYGLDPFASD